MQITEKKVCATRSYRMTMRQAYAEILLVNGNPFAKPELFNSPEENLTLIKKVGKI